MIFKNFFKSLYFNFIIIVLIFALDRITKMYIIYLNNISINSELYVSKFLNLSLVWNEGIAFGLLSFDQNNLYNLLTLIISIIILVMLVIMMRAEGIQKNFLAMIMGGAVGNLYDRIFFKAVPDFIDFHIDNFHWFIFNIADVFITIGIIFMILNELIVNNDDYEKN